MRSSFVRKLVYMGLAVVLFVVILVVRRPIEQQRTTHKLSEATLGDVDPTSSTMLVVLGGLRGIASNILWIQAQELQTKHDWSNLKVVVDSITTLEPHFISVWTFQGWNQAYNVSAEWDQVADKYYWIKEGIRFLERGTEANERSPELRWDVGWTFFHKIGRADEADLLRKIHRADTASEVDAQGRVREPFNRDGQDNFKASYGWFAKAVDKCDDLKVKPKRMGEVPFRAYPSHALINYAIAHEKEGNFGERIQADWDLARQSLERYADHDFNFTPSRAVHLDYRPEIYADLYRATSVLTDSRNLNEAVTKDLDTLTDEQKGNLPADWDKLITESRRMLNEFNRPTISFLPPGAADAFESMEKVLPKMQQFYGKQVVEPGAAGDSVRTLLAEFAAAAETLGKFADEELYWCDRYATMINFRYWLARTICESEMETIDARQHFYVGEQQFKAADLETARTEFEKGLELWKPILEKYEHLRSDDATAEDIATIVKKYLSVRAQLDLPDLPPEQIPFEDLVKRFTPHQPTPEEYEMMRQQQLQSQQPAGPGADMKGEMKKAILEKLQGTLKDALKPTPDPKAGESPEK